MNKLILLSAWLAFTTVGFSQTKQDELAIQFYTKIQQLYENDYSEIFNMFHGIHVSQIFNESGDLISNNPETFYSIDLPLPLLAGSLTTPRPFPMTPVTEGL